MGGSKQRWVLWQRPKGGKAWQLRKGRYKSSEAAEDAKRTLALEHMSVQFLALPEGKEPQDNKRAAGVE